MSLRDRKSRYPASQKGPASQRSTYCSIREKRVPKNYQLLNHVEKTNEQLDHLDHLVFLAMKVYLRLSTCDNKPKPVPKLNFEQANALGKN